MAIIVVQGIPQEVSQHDLMKLRENLQKAASGAYGATFKPEDVAVFFPHDRLGDCPKKNIFAQIHDIGRDEKGSQTFALAYDISECVGILLKNTFPKNLVQVHSYMDSEHLIIWESS